MENLLGLRLLVLPLFFSLTIFRSSNKDPLPSWSEKACEGMQLSLVRPSATAEEKDIPTSTSAKNMPSVRTWRRGDFFGPS